MADIDSLIAGGARTQADFTAIPGIATSYWEGMDQGFKNRARDVFKGGIPTNDDGSPNYAEAAKRLYQVGDIGNANTMSNLDIQRQQLSLGQAASKALGGIESGSGQAPLNVPSIGTGPPSMSRAASVAVAPPIGQGGAAGPSSGNASGKPTVMQVLTAQGIPNDQLGPASASIARQLGLDDPNAALDLNDPQVRNVLGPALAQLKRMGIGQVVGQPAPQAPQPQAPQQAVPPAPVAAAPPQAQTQVTDTRGTAPTTQDPNVQARMAQYTQIMSNPALPESVRNAAKLRLEALQKNSELTTTQKEYEQARRDPKFKDYQAETEALKTVSTEQAKADVKEQTDIIGAGRTAQNRLATLNTISNIVNTDKNLTQGFGAETALKVKMALEQMGVPVGDLSGAQSIQKLNAVLASESTKAISPRPAQFEFKTFLANNPGLNLDKAGNQRVIGIYSQLAKREVDLGQLARKTRDNWDNWDQVVKNYDENHPMRDPKTGQPITTDTIVAPGKGGDIFEKARAAIAQGAPKDAVIKRLKENGHDPAGL